MKRLWIGIGILAALLGAGLWAMFSMDHIHSAISEELEQAAQTVQDSGWEEAAALTDSAKEDWETHWRFSAALADHSSIDQIDGLFAQLKVYEDRRDTTSYAAACAQLAQMVSALEEGHRLSWWNLL